jgi:hypothetical protein
MLEREKEKVIPLHRECRVSAHRIEEIKIYHSWLASTFQQPVITEFEKQKVFASLLLIAPSKLQLYWYILF